MIAIRVFYFATLAFMFFSPVHAEEEKKDCWSVMIEKNCVDETGDIKSTPICKKMERSCDTQSGISGSALLTTCRDAKEKYDDLGKEFQGYCTTIGVSDCQEQIRACQNVMEASSSLSPRELRSRASAHKIKEMAENFDKCPIAQEELLVQLGLRAKKVKERVENLDEKVTAAQDRLDRLKESRQESISDIQTDITRVSDKILETAGEIQETMNAGQAAQQRLLQEAQSQKTDAENGIRQLIADKANAQTAYESAIAAIEIECAEKVESQMTEFRRLKAAQMENGTFFQQGGLRGLTRRTNFGIGRSKKADNYATIFLKRCLKSEITRAKKMTAKKQHQAQINQIETRIKSAQNSLETLIQQVAENVRRQQSGMEQDQQRYRRVMENQEKLKQELHKKLKLAQNGLDQTSQSIMKQQRQLIQLNMLKSQAESEKNLLLANEQMAGISADKEKVDEKKEALLAAIGISESIKQAKDQAKMACCDLSGLGELNGSEKRNFQIQCAAVEDKKSSSRPKVKFEKQRRRGTQ